MSTTFNEELLLDCDDTQFNIVLLQSPNYVLNLENPVNLKQLFSAFIFCFKL